MGTLASLFGYEDKLSLSSYAYDTEFPSSVLKGFVLLFGEKNLKLHSVLISFSLFSVLFIAIKLLVLPLVAKCKKKQVPAQTEMSWSQTIVHLLYAPFIVSLSMGYIHRQYNDNAESTLLTQDITNSASIDSILILCLITGFTVHELATLMAARHCMNYFNPSIFLQDLLVVSCAGMLLYYEQGHYIGMITEMAMECIYIMHSITWMIKQYGANTLYKFLQLLTLYLCSYCSLMGMYCLYLSYNQVDALVYGMPVPLLVTLYVSLLIAFFLVIPACLAKLLEMDSLNKRMKVVKIPNGVYRLSNISLAQLNNSPIGNEL